MVLHSIERCRLTRITNLKKKCWKNFKIFYHKTILKRKAIIRFKTEKRKKTKPKIPTQCYSVRRTRLNCVFRNVIIIRLKNAMIDENRS